MWYEGGMEMSRTLAGVLAGCLVLAMATVAGAGIPDADESFVTMSPLTVIGLTTCPAGDFAPWGEIVVDARNSAGDPISDIPSSNFFFTAVGTGSDNVSFHAVGAATDVNGQIAFDVQGDGTVPYGTLTITVQIYTVAVNDSDVLTCNTFDYDADNDVDPVDFGQFAGDFNGTAQRSDFDWDGDVDPVDFGQFGLHFGH
mgnify:CR=1 FL=1